jgi:hypothetical protein
LWIDTFSEENACFKVERVVLNALANKCASGAEFLASATALGWGISCAFGDLFLIVFGEADPPQLP